MRAKLKIQKIEQFEQSETITFNAVCKNNYGLDGLDEDNTFAKFTPTASLIMIITNPVLLGMFKPGEKYYIDFMKTD